MLGEVCVFACMTLHCLLFLSSAARLWLRVIYNRVRREGEGLWVGGCATGEGGP